MALAISPLIASELPADVSPSGAASPESPSTKLRTEFTSDFASLLFLFFPALSVGGDKGGGAAMVEAALGNPVVSVSDGLFTSFSGGGAEMAEAVSLTLINEEGNGRLQMPERAIPAVLGKPVASVPNGLFISFSGGETEMAEAVPLTLINNEEGDRRLQMPETVVPAALGKPVASVPNGLFTSFFGGGAEMAEGVPLSLINEDGNRRFQMPETVVPAALGKPVASVANGLFTSFSGGGGEMAEGVPLSLINEDGNGRLQMPETVVPAALGKPVAPVLNGLFTSLSGEEGMPATGKPDVTPSGKEFLPSQGPRAGAGTDPQIFPVEPSKEISFFVPSRPQLPQLPGATSKPGGESNTEGFSEFFVGSDAGKQDSARAGNSKSQGVEGRDLLKTFASPHRGVKGALAPLSKLPPRHLHLDETQAQGKGLVAQPMPLGSQPSSISPQPSLWAWHPVIERVAGEIYAQMRANKHEVIIHLEPPELGKLKINLVIQGNEVLARITAEVTEVRSLIQTHLPDLRQALQDHSLELGEVTVDVSEWGEETGELPQGFEQESETPEGSSQRSAVSGEKSVETEVAHSDQIGGVSVWA